MISVNYRNSKGLSLLEMILVIGIMASILLLSIRQYQSYRLDSDMRQLEYNVDALFQAMGKYYRANCYGTTVPGADPAGTLQPGALHPNNNPSDPFPINIQTDLRDNGFLTENYPISPLLDETGPGNGYVVQFNRHTQPRTLCIDPPICSSTRTIGTIVFWTAQVAVLLRDPTLAQDYLQVLRGHCLSSFAGGTVTPCPGVGDYIVWERMPSFASPASTSSYWSMNPILDRFNQLYTTYPITYLLDTAGQTPSGPQYYLCGS